jgi:uncharacterized membrane protein YkvA (DUF1232 family)
MTSPLTATLEERIDDGTLQRASENIQANNPDAASSTAPAPKTWLARFMENALAKRVGHRQLVKLAADRGRIAKAWSELPGRMHLAANQTKLMMELVDDFRAGRYREMPWRSLVVVAAAILYVASPADVIPDVISGLGVLDDVAVAALATRVVRSDLEAYCKFKGYRLDEYFADR